MRIAVFSPVFVRPSETFVCNSVTGLAEAGHQVVVLTRKRQLAGPEPVHLILLAAQWPFWHPARVRNWAMRRLGRRGLRTAPDKAARASLRQYLTSLAPDVMLAHYGHSGVFVSPVTQSLGIPLIVAFHGADAFRLPRDPRWRRQYEELFRASAAVTAPSAYLCRHLLGLGCPQDKAHIMHNAVRLDRIVVNPPGARYQGGQVRFLCVGRLTPKKNPVGLLTAFRKAVDALGPGQAHLDLVGDGPLRDAVASARASLDLEHTVTLHGKQDHARVIELYAESHIYVQHSVIAEDGDREGLPVSISEAMAAALPVLATRHSGIPEVVKDTVNGFLVDEHDLDGMAQRMVDIARAPDSWDAMGREGYRLIKREFSGPVVQARLEALLQDVTHTSARASASAVSALVDTTVSDQH